MNLLPLSLNSSLSATNVLAAGSSYDTFHGSNCTNIDSCRTRWDIVWSCLGTIFACVWVAVHPNLPQLYTSRKRWTREWFKQLVALFWDRLLISILALLAPELIFAWALRQRIAASALAKKFGAMRKPNILAGRVSKEASSLSERSETGTAVETLELLEESGSARTTPEHENEAADYTQSSGTLASHESEITMTHCFFVLMGGFHLYDGDRPVCVLLPKDVLELVRDGKLLLPPSEDLEDRGKSDWVAKTIVVIQTSWFVVQCLARFIEDLSVTDLEIVTLAYTSLVGAIYVCWWDKPSGVTQPIRIPIQSFPAIAAGHDEVFSSRNGLLYLLGILVGSTKNREKNWARVPRLFTGADLVASDPSMLATLAIFASMFGFGAIHFIAWSSYFPSDPERWLWRVDSLLTVGIPGSGVVGIVCFLLFGSVRNIILDALRSGWMTEIFDGLNDIMFAIWLHGTLLYPIARLLLIVVSFTTLRSLPPSAYETVSWTKLIPHV